MKRLLRSPVALLCATVFTTLAAMPVAVLGAGQPAPGGIILVIAPPWASGGGAAGVVAAAGGREVVPMRAPFAVLAVFDDQPTARTLGAWMVLDGRVIAAICGATSDEYFVGAGSV